MGEINPYKQQPYDAMYYMDRQTKSSATAAEHKLCAVHKFPKLALREQACNDSKTPETFSDQMRCWNTAEQAAEQPTLFCGLPKLVKDMKHWFDGSNRCKSTNY